MRTWYVIVLTVLLIVMAEVATACGTATSSSTLSTVPSGQAGSMVPTSTHTTIPAAPEVPTTVSVAGATTTLPAIEFIGEPKTHYLDPATACKEADAVVLGRVIEVLPLRQNPLADETGTDGAEEHQPVEYKGYVMAVEKVYGPESVSRHITVYAQGTGIYTAPSGKQYEMRNDLPLDLNVGDTAFVPLVKTAYFGTPELLSTEFWALAPWATYLVDGWGNARRATGTEYADSEGIPNSYPLATLEEVAVKSGKSLGSVQ